MKSVKIYVCAFFALFVALSALRADSEKIINFEGLPVSAQELIKTHFPDKKIFKVESELDSSGIEYEVKFEDRTELTFNSKGEWTEISSEVSGVPSKLIPAKIFEYVKLNQTGGKITSIKKKAYGYKIEIDDKFKMLFDKSFNFLGKD